MVKHIVMWKLFEEAEGYSKAENAERVKSRLKELKAAIPEIKSMQVGININRSPDAYDIVLYSEFENLYDLKTYQDHPNHIAFKEFIQNIRSDKKVVDFVA